MWRALSDPQASSSWQCACSGCSLVEGVREDGERCCEGLLQGCGGHVDFEYVSKICILCFEIFSVKIRSYGENLKLVQWGLGACCQA